MTNSRSRRYGRGIRSKQPDICPTTGKRSHATPETAQSELVSAQRLRAAQRNVKVESRFYLCMGCMKYHLTSMKGMT